MASARFRALSARIFVLALTLAAASGPLVAQGTHLWTQSRTEEFEKGTPQGVAIGSDGLLREAPGVKEILTTPSTFAWSVAAGKDGVAYVGTGSPATVLGVSPDGKSTTLFETRDLSVQVVRLGPDGALYAATMPSGKVYKLNPSAGAKQDQDSATVVFDAARVPASAETAADKKNDKQAGKSSDDKTAHYIWDMTFDAAGRLYIATGGPGIVYRVDPAKPATPAEIFFKSDEQHIRCLAWDAKGNLIAGTDGTGLIYRIDGAGKGYVLFAAPRREIPAIAIGADGAIYAAAVGDKTHNPLPPLPVQGNGVVTITVMQPGSLQAANASTSAPDGTEIYVLKEGQAPRKLWAGKDEVVYALAPRKDGILVLSGNRGRIFYLHADGSFADIAHLEAQQGLSLAERGAESEDAVLIGTGNTGKLVSLGPADSHQYVSDVLDAGALARFGRAEVQTGSKDFQLLTRSGNVEQPVRGWSDWQALRDGSVASPAGRFLQWKIVLGKAGVVGSVGVNYLPVNAAPQVDEVVVVPGARLNPSGQSINPQTINIALPSANSGVTVSFDAGTGNGTIAAVKDRTAVTARWAAHDDNGDDLTFSLYLRGDGEKTWRLLKDSVTDKAYSFDQTAIPDGGYELKVVASDAPSHTPADALAGEKISERFEIDTTPPVISNLKVDAEQPSASHATSSVHVTLDAEDALSPVVRAEYSLDAGPWQYVEPVGALSDSRREHYDFTVPADSLKNKPGEHLITVRVYDRHDNIGLAKATFDVPAEAK